MTFAFAEVIYHPIQLYDKVAENGKKRWVLYTDVKSFCANADMGNRR